jgi:hypothetical protein
MSWGKRKVWPGPRPVREPGMNWSEPTLEHSDENYAKVQNDCKSSNLRQRSFSRAERRSLQDATIQFNGTRKPSERIAVFCTDQVLVPIVVRERLAEADID